MLAQEFRYSDTRFYGMSDQERLEAMRTAELPERNAPGWPALRLENRAYSSRVFRKLHMELGVRQDGLQVAVRHYTPCCQQHSRAATSDAEVGLLMLCTTAVCANVCAGVPGCCKMC